MLITTVACIVTCLLAYATHPYARQCRLFFFFFFPTSIIPRMLANCIVAWIKAKTSREMQDKSTTCAQLQCHVLPGSSSRLAPATALLSTPTAEAKLQISPLPVESRLRYSRCFFFPKLAFQKKKVYAGKPLTFRLVSLAAVTPVPFPPSTPTQPKPAGWQESKCAALQCNAWLSLASPGRFPHRIP